MSMTFKSCKAAALSLFRSGASFTRDEDGATAIEYGLIASLIIIAIIGAMSTFSENTSGMYTTIATTLSGG